LKLNVLLTINKKELSYSFLEEQTLFVYVCMCLPIVVKWVIFSKKTRYFESFDEGKIFSNCFQISATIPVTI